MLILLGVALAAAAGFTRWGDPAGPERLSPAPLADALKPDQPDEAMQFRLLQLEDEEKQIPADGLLKAKAQLEVMQSAQAQRAKLEGKPEGVEVAKLQPGDWVSVGPGNIGGRIRAVVIDPNNANKIWIGSATGGIWSSTTAGASWAPVDDFMANLVVSTLVINPTNSSELYAGTGESFIVRGSRGLGVFKSTNGGVSWSQLAQTNPADLAVCPDGSPCPWFYINRLAISPNGATVLAATENSIRRSTDGGASWSQAIASMEAWKDIRFHPTDSQKAIASGVRTAAYSTDDGQNWNAASFNPPIVVPNPPPRTGRVELAYARSSPNIVFASVNVNGGEIYRSTDGGQSFVQVQTGSSYLGAQGNYDNTIWVNPVDPNMVVVGGIDLWRSTNAASANPVNLTQISMWQCAPQTGIPCQGTSVHADHHAIVAAPGFDNASNKRVYFGNDGGFYRTDDISAVGQTSGWVNLNNNLRITQFYSGVALPDQTLFGGTQDNGNLRAIPDTTFIPPYNAQGWTTPIGATGDGGFVATDPNDGRYVFAEFTNLRISRSVDGGGTFGFIYCDPASINATTGRCTSSTGITDAVNGASFVAPFILDPSNANRMLAGGLSLWRSNEVKTAQAPTWSAIKEPVSDGETPPANVPVSAIAVAENNSDLIVVGHNEGEVFITSNGTAASPNWVQVDVALPDRFVTRLTIDSTRSPQWIYATFGGFSPDNVYVTKDLGLTWLEITGAGATGLPDVPVRSLAINPVRADFLYLGTEVGIFASEDAGATWQLPHGGPANVAVDELFFASGKLAAATHGRGMFLTGTPAYIPGGGGSACIFPGTCDPNFNCTPGDWDCPCTWGGGRVPGPQDDVAVQCANIRGGSRSVRNLRVNNRLSMADAGVSISVSGTLSNYATISGGNVFTKHLVNTGTISTAKVRAQAGDIYNAGTILSSAGWGFYSGDEYPVQANNITVDGEGYFVGVGILCKGNLVVGPNASIHALSGGPAASINPGLFVHGHVHNDGEIDVRGQMGFTTFNDITSAHNLSGLGEWRIGMLILGDRDDPRFGPPALFSLGSDVTLDVLGLSDYGGYPPTLTFQVASNVTVKQNNHILTVNSPYLTSYGQYDLGAGTLNLNIPYIKTRSEVSPGRISSLGPPGFKGSGNVNLTAVGDTYLELDTRIFDPAFHLKAGTANGIMGTIFNGPVTIDAGATLNVNGGVLEMRGDLLVNGAIGKISAANLRSSFSFLGSTITNNGSIGGDIFQFNYRFDAVPRNMTLAGAGAWPAATLVRVGISNVATTLALANDMTLNWNTLSISAASQIATGASTLTMPCSSTFDTSHPSLSGEIIGRVRRTNLGDCAGVAIPFTSGFTTVRFNSGTPPSEMAISVTRTAPPGFPGAVLRDYQITPLGGSGYSATLRLDYSPAETNGNPTGTLALWRNDGANWITQGATARDLSAHWVELSGVTQFSPWALASCALSISPAGTSVAAGGGTSSFQVTSTGTCGWTATSNAPWITITSGASGSGNGTVGFTAAANTGGQRSGTITITGATGGTQNFSVSQAPDCSGLALNPTSANVAASSNSGSIAVTATSGCGWAATSNASWITVTSGASGSGNGTVGYHVQTNSGPARSGTISVSGQTFTITQASGCYYFFGGNEQGIAAAGGSLSTQIYTPDSCPWDVVSNADWITITPPANGTGPSVLNYAVAANPGPPRVGTFSMGDQTFTVSQGSAAPLAFVVTNTDNEGAGSLRQVLLDANANFGQANTISFNLTGGVTITTPQALPNIRNAVVINGINQDGRRVVLDGAGGGGGVVEGDGGGGYYGLVVMSADTTIRGLSFVRFYGSAINLSSDRNTIENCYIGTNPAGAPGLGNGTGIEIYSSNNRIGGTAPGTGNTIAFNNGLAGVGVYSGVNNAIRGNSIFGNNGLGIDLGGDGVTPNGASGSGPNNLQRFPVLTTSPGANKIDVALDAAPNGTFAVELFVNDVCNPAGYGEGRSFLGKVDVVTGANGHGSFTFDLPSFVTTGNFITATTTDAAGNTSEFSLCLEVTPLRIGVVKQLATGHIRLDGIGVPNQQHTIEIRPSLSGTAMPTFVTNMADAEGKWQYEDSGQSGLSMRFYRLRFP